MTVELAEPPQAVDDIAGPSVYDIPMAGVPNATFGYSTPSIEDEGVQHRLVLDGTGRGWLTLPRMPGRTSVFVFYAFGDLVGPTREITVP